MAGGGCDSSRSYKRGIKERSHAYQSACENFLNENICICLRNAYGHSPVPEGIHLLFLPSKSPELQTAERLWTLTNEAIGNQSFADLNQLEATTAYRCLILLKRPDLIKGLTNFHWWAEAVS